MPAVLGRPGSASEGGLQGSRASIILCLQGGDEEQGIDCILQVPRGPAAVCLQGWDEEQGIYCSLQGSRDPPCSSHGVPAGLGRASGHHCHLQGSQGPTLRLPWCACRAGTSTRASLLPAGVTGTHPAAPMVCLQGWDAEEAIDRSLQALFILNGRYMEEVEELRRARAAHTDRQDIAFPIGECQGPGVMPACTLIPCRTSPSPSVSSGAALR